MLPDRARRNVIVAIGLALLAAIIFASQQFGHRQTVQREPLGLMTSLPIYWADGAEFDDLVSGKTDAPWVRKTLETRFELMPLDTLAADADSTSKISATGRLKNLRNLLVVQPRGLSPADNVALDDWVQAGGHLLIVLDPMLTGSYAVPLGDPRHPTSAALIPPVIERWGMLALFDERQPLELREVDTRMGPIPTMMAGTIELTPKGEQYCQLDGQSLIATCRIGKGRVTLLADAVLFELPQDTERAEDMLLALAAHAFG